MKAFEMEIIDTGMGDDPLILPVTDLFSKHPLYHRFVAPVISLIISAIGSGDGIIVEVNRLFLAGGTGNPDDKNGLAGYLDFRYIRILEEVLAYFLPVIQHVGEVFPDISNLFEPIHGEMVLWFLFDPKKDHPTVGICHGTIGFKE